MAVGGDVSSYYQYTTVWLHSKDNGGLFQINDATFLFSRAVEIGTQRHLPTHIRSASKSNSKETLIRSIMEDEDVLFLWDMLAVDIRDQDHSSELLELLIELWRGYSLASSWLEEYKQANKKGKGTKKSKALRKELKGPVQGDIMDDLSFFAFCHIFIHIPNSFSSSKSHAQSTTGTIINCDKKKLH